MNWAEVGYSLEQWADQLLRHQLASGSLWLGGLAVLAGLATSLSPCTLSMLPIAIAYIGGTKQEKQLWCESLGFACGLALTLTGLGLTAALLGGVYGQWGRGWLNSLVGAVAIAMGLQLLEVWAMPLPAWGNGWVERLPKVLRSLGVGITFGLAASPCSTPVLLTLLAWVASTGKVVLGAGLLFCYALGAAMPLVVAGLFTGMVKQFLAWRQWSQWLSWGSGVVLLGFGVITLLQTWQLRP
ncbi:MAG: cytochrome c biogenesis protein CcdA [Pseudanabaenaceae cyanobacterium]